MKYYLMLVIILASMLSVGISVTASVQGNEQGNQESQAQQRLARQAKITREQAQEVALKRAPGNVESGELEREHGKLVYSFDIRNAKGTITEVQVSAINGRVVRVEQENKKQEAAEKRKEQKEKSGNNRQP
jgi:uncharacterized membrane protein YkoI